MAEKTESVSVYLEPAVLRDLRAIAKEEDRSLSWMISFAVKAYVEQRVHGTVPLEPSVLKHHAARKQVDIEDAIVAAVKRGPVKSTGARKK